VAVVGAMELVEGPWGVDIVWRVCRVQYIGFIRPLLSSALIAPSDIFGPWTWTVFLTPYQFQPNNSGVD
jgi:hypothetical protein